MSKTNFIETVFRTKDGKEFDTMLKAEKYVEEHLNPLTLNEKAFNDFLKRSSGKSLLKKYSLQDVGLWELKGEDPNCDYGGYHHQPRIGFYHGTLEDAIKKAIESDLWFTWGAGGSVARVEVMA